MNKIANIFRESTIASFFIPFGIILIVFGVITFIISTNNKDYIETEASVYKVTLYEEAYTDVDGNYVDATYDITIKYTVDGREYTGEFSGLPKYNIGDKMKIYYNPEDPSQITQTKSIILPIAIILAGIASLVGGIISSTNTIKKYKKLKVKEEN